ncbi:hypothetical protein M9H77_25409 [Catharanthus roseus]|uniref:Uncharacterized protein n=1 Tax=Catharanthus roseus TaxID=4058 RepID=A0ACC0A7Q2_CATRO|nr:hypothetical protein M9H77_25409 [Catharanthus roseus]
MFLILPFFLNTTIGRRELQCLFAEKIITWLLPWIKGEKRKVVGYTGLRFMYGKKYVCNTKSIGRREANQFPTCTKRIRDRRKSTVIHGKGASPYADFSVSAVYKCVTIYRSEKC